MKCDPMELEVSTSRQVSTECSLHSELTEVRDLRRSSCLASWHAVTFSPCRVWVFLDFLVEHHVSMRLFLYMSYRVWMTESISLTDRCSQTRQNVQHIDSILSPGWNHRGARRGRLLLPHRFPPEYFNFVTVDLHLKTALSGAATNRHYFLQCIY